jgi:hypothetical protein
VVRQGHLPRHRQLAADQAYIRNRMVQAREAGMVLPTSPPWSWEMVIRRKPAEGRHGDDRSRLDVGDVSGPPHAVGAMHLYPPGQGAP